MRVLPLLVLLCVAVLSVQASGKYCKYFGQICPKGRNCIPGYPSPALVCRSRKLLDGAAKLCRFGGSWCPDRKVCRNTKAGRRCVFRPWTIKKLKVRACKKVGQWCAKGRKCIPCYVRGGLCCRRASLIGGKKYCGQRYRSYGKFCHYGKKGKCFKYGTYCADGKICRKLKNGRRLCVFKKSQPKCSYFGQICGVKGDRNCIPCFYRKGLCCRRRKLLATGAKLCRYGGKWCPDNKVCRQSIKKRVITRRCEYVPVCKFWGQTCGLYKRRVCIRCGHKNKKLCCRKGVTKSKCQKSCRGRGRYCSISKCSKGHKGWCCLRRYVPVCKFWGQTCGLYKRRVCIRCGYKNKKLCCRKGVTKSKCQKSCRGRGRYCSISKCSKGYKGWCCLRRYVPVCKFWGQTCGLYKRRVCIKCGLKNRKLCCRKGVTKSKCQKSCSGRGRYCSISKCSKGYKGWCCLRRCKGKKYCRRG